MPELEGCVVVVGAGLGPLPVVPLLLPHPATIAHSNPMPRTAQEIRIMNRPPIAKPDRAREAPDRD